MQVVILAGGKGTRLKPYTAVFPKPLVPLGDKPILEIVISQLVKAGFDDVIISTGHLSHLIEAYFGDGSRFGAHIRYVHEDKPLSTAGALRLIDRLEPNFLVMNGDILTSLDYQDLYRSHIESGAAATIGIIEREDKIDYGVIKFKGDRFEEYIEKPTTKIFVSMGVNVLNRIAVGYIKENEAIGIPDLMTRLHRASQKVCVYNGNCSWLDIGRPADYEKAQQMVGSDED